jgi:hypothetical protein
VPGILNETFEITDEGHHKLIDKYLIKISENQYDKCSIKYFPANFSQNVTNDNFIIRKCDDWLFSDQYYGKTIVTDVSMML